MSDSATMRELEAMMAEARLLETASRNGDSASLKAYHQAAERLTSAVQARKTRHELAMGLNVRASKIVSLFAEGFMHKFHYAGWPHVPV